MKTKYIMWLIVIGILLVGATFRVPVWKRHSANSIQVERTEHRYIVFPTCPTDRTVMEFGTFCKDPNTGTIFYRGTLEAIP